MMIKRIKILLFLLITGVSHASNDQKTGNISDYYLSEIFDLTECNLDKLMVFKFGDALFLLPNKYVISFRDGLVVMKRSKPREDNAGFVYFGPSKQVNKLDKFTIFLDEVEKYSHNGLNVTKRKVSESSSMTHLTIHDERNMLIVYEYGELVSVLEESLKNNSCKQ